MYSPRWVPVTELRADDLVPLRDHILDPKAKAGEALKEHRPHLLERLCPGRPDRQWRADQHVRLEDLVDRIRDQFQIAGVDGVIEASDSGFVAHFLIC
jgi:hypothetical protein